MLLYLTQFCLGHSSFKCPCRMASIFVERL